METDERIGVIEPRVILTRSGEIQNEPQNWPLQNIFIGCAFLSRRSALLSIGLRPSEYFLYGSELDISIKLLKKNWKVMHCSDITAMHSEAEAMRSSAMLVELFCRNNLWNIVRHYSGWNIVYQLSFHVVFSAYLGLRNRRYLAFLKGLVRGFVGLKKNAIDQRKVDWDQDTCLLYPPTRILMRVLKNRILS